MNPRFSQLIVAIVLATLTLTTATTMGAVLPAPPTFGGTNLELWLSARSLSQTNGSKVVSWADAGIGTLGLSAVAPSGKEPTFVTNGLNGQPTVRFNGTSDYMNIASNTLSVGTVVIVASYTLPTFNYYDGLFNAGYITAPPDSAKFIYFVGAGPGTKIFYAGAADQNYYVNNVPTTTITTLNQFNVYAITDATPDTGTALDVASGGSGNTYFDAWRLGMERDLSFIPARNWHGDIAEVLIYDQVLSSSQFVDVYSYIDAVYGFDLVPEPASLSLLAVGGMVVLQWRRRSTAVKS